MQTCYDDPKSQDINLVREENKKADANSEDEQEGPVENSNAFACKVLADAIENALGFFLGSFELMSAYRDEHSYHDEEIEKGEIDGMRVLSNRLRVVLKRQDDYKHEFLVILNDESNQALPEESEIIDLNFLLIVFFLEDELKRSLES